MVDLPDRIPGLERLQFDAGGGDPGVLIAVIDGPVDCDHPALSTTNMTTAAVNGEQRAQADDQSAVHGTYVASIIFGNGTEGVKGVAPGCRGLIIPIFDRHRRRVPQVDIARAIEYAVNAGAHIINFSGGQHSDSGDAEDLLAKAAATAEENGVLLVAAAGNDGCDCLHVPAAIPTTLAVGALDETSEPLESSNWGPIYAENGLTAPGSDILGAAPGNATVRASGTSSAAPIVSGVAALMVSLQIQSGKTPEPLAVRRMLLDGAQPCTSNDENYCRRLLGGILDIEGARQEMSKVPTTEEIGRSATEASDVDASECPYCAARHDVTAAGPSTTAPAVVVEEQGASQSAGLEAELSMVYALGTVGYDFGNEARRDSFKQLMSPNVSDGVAGPANPHDSRQMVRHLGEYAQEAQSLIWTLNLELTPLYALEAVGPYASDAYDVLRQLLEGEIQAPTSEEFIERVSIPGRMSGRSVKLFSGQVVPVVEIDSTRGLYGWRTVWLLETAAEQLKAVRGEDVDENLLREAVTGFLNRVYFDMRNLGTLSRDRALNFAATNVFQASTAFAEALTVGMQLDDIDVVPSPYARADADAWDVKLKFFDPENLRRARRVFRFTVDVSEVMPVTMGEVRAWSTSN